MRRIFASLFALAPVASVIACTQETVTKPAAAAPDEAQAEAPAEPEAEAPSCNCPSTCANENEPKKMTCIPRPAPENIPDKQTIGEYVVSSYEFWPWKLPEPIYPDKVQWGYAAGGPEAKKCVAEARRVLVNILKNDVPPELDELRTKHGVKTFYQWNNDMTGAPKSVKIPELYEGLWLYEEGLIKWMSHTERDGTCRIPTREDLVTFAKSCLETFPNCDSGK